jgi:hypothetical protein
MILRSYLPLPSLSIPMLSAADRRFDPSTPPQYAQIPGRSSFPCQSTIANARAHSRCLQSLVTSDSYSRNVVVTFYQCSLILITICNFVNKVGDIMGATMKTKADVEIVFVNQRIANRELFMEPINVD